MMYQRKSDRAAMLDGSDAFWEPDILKIDLQLCLPQRHCLGSRDDGIAYQRPSIFSHFNYPLLMTIVYTACILNYAHEIAVLN